MQNILLGLFAAVAVTALLFISALLSAAGGAFAGWAVSLTPLGDWIRHALDNPSYTLAELGALLGFVGAFFRSRLALARDYNAIALKLWRERIDEEAKVLAKRREEANREFVATVEDDSIF